MTARTSLFRGKARGHRPRLQRSFSVTIPRGMSGANVSPTGRNNQKKAARDGIFRRAARATSDWVDLQWSLLIRALRTLAPRTHGRALDVGCGDKPYEAIFRPYVDEYVGIEKDSTFHATAANLGM